MKDKVVAVSIALFEKKGFSETSIQDIVDELGLTKGTFYHYYSSKEQLLMDIHLRYIEDLLQAAQQIVDDPDSESVAKLQAIIRLLIKQIRTNGQEGSVFFREMRNLTGDNFQQIKVKRDQFRFHFQTIIEQGMETGAFRRDLRADMVALGLLGMCNWSYSWFDPEGAVNEDELSAIYMEMALKGIQAD
ncbi:MAG: TetR/AcrR family transcriptional regulator [Clostridia bacterium]